MNATAAATKSMPRVVKYVRYGQAHTFTVSRSGFSRSNLRRERSREIAMST
jgi:hypothetical protein